MTLKRAALLRSRKRDVVAWEGLSAGSNAKGDPNRGADEFIGDGDVSGAPVEELSFYKDEAGRCASLITIHVTTHVRTQMLVEAGSAWSRL